MGESSTGNLDHWNEFADIDPEYTKPITGKAYKGTSPNPQYVIKCLTEMFGPVGKGFGWDVVAEDFTPLGDELLHWCRIRFWHGTRDNHWDSYGQTKALMKTRNGLMSDEDAPKKSLTDAIIKAASQLGIAANIFLGRWDDQKHVQEVTETYRKAKTPPVDHSADAAQIVTRLKQAGSVDELAAIWKSEASTIAAIKTADPDAYAIIGQAKDNKKTQLQKDAS